VLEDGPEGTQRDCSATSEWRRRSLARVGRWEV
jgi:hypothetical protein